MKSFLYSLWNTYKFQIFVCGPSFLLIMFFKIMDIAAYRKIYLLSRKKSHLIFLSYFLLIVISFIPAVLIPRIFDMECFFQLLFTAPPIICILDLLTMQLFEHKIIESKDKRDNISAELARTSLKIFFLYTVSAGLTVFCAVYLSLGNIFGLSKDDEKKFLVYCICYVLVWLTSAVIKILAKTKIVGNGQSRMSLEKTEE